MSLESTIAALVTASNNLTNAVNGKIASIDSKVAEATAAVPAVVRAEVSKSIYVDASVGLDTNAGTSEAAPLKTIGAALGRTMTGGTSYIYLRKGQVHQVGRIVGNYNADRRAITFMPYGAEASAPIVRAMPGKASDMDAAYVAGFQGSNSLSLKFVDVRIETGINNTGLPIYDSGFGGFFTRSAAFGESVSFEVMFLRCTVVIQDFKLLTTYYGFAKIGFAQSSIVKGGVETKIIASAIPKMLDISTVSIEGFGAGATVETLFNISAGNTVSRNASVSFV